MLEKIKELLEKSMKENADKFKQMKLEEKKTEFSLYFKQQLDYVATQIKEKLPEIDLENYVVIGFDKADIYAEQMAKIDMEFKEMLQQLFEDEMEKQNITEKFLDRKMTELEV